jgi:hypothetical protein
VDALKLEMTDAAQRSNPAATSTGAAIAKLHCLLPEQAPPQPRKRERPSGVALSVTELPRRNE